MRPSIPGDKTVTWLRGINISFEFIQEKFGKDRFYCPAVLFFPHNEQPAVSILIIVLAILPPVHKGVKP